ncbi:MAG: DsbA family oxidoreductase [Nitrospiraceae bacterium]
MPTGKWIQLFSDFNCPFCYAMHERIHAVGVVDLVEWRGVQHAPFLPVPMTAWHSNLAAELRQEVDVVRRLAPKLPIVVPEGKPNTRLAIAVAARALRHDAFHARQLIGSLYRAFWQEGADISRPEVLKQVAEKVRLSADRLLGDEAPDVSAIVRDWEAAWNETGHGAVPLLIRSNGEQLVGLTREEDVMKFFQD